MHSCLAILVLTLLKQSSDNIDFEVLRGLTNALLAAKKPDQVCNSLFSITIILQKNISIFTLWDSY